MCTILKYLLFKAHMSFIPCFSIVGSTLTDRLLVSVWFMLDQRMRATIDGLSNRSSGVVVERLPRIQEIGVRFLVGTSPSS